MNTEAHRLYREMIAADDRFSAALRARYGCNAGDARYRKLPPDLEALAQEVQAAAKRYFDVPVKTSF